MEDILVKIHNAFNHTLFIKEKHKYYDREIKEYLPSSTGVKKLFIPEFPEAVKIPCARKKGITVKQLEAEWEFSRKKGLQRGNFVHQYLENIFKRRIVKDFDRDLLTNQELKKLEALCRNFYNDYRHWIHIDAEIVISNHVVAGQIDHLFYNPETKELILGDVKTDKDIYKPAYNDLLVPLSHLDDSVINQYSIQLSIYKDIFEEMTNLKIDKIMIIWINDKNDNYEIVPIKPIDLTDVWNMLRNNKSDE